MAKLSLVQSFVADFRSLIPDTEKPGAVKPYEFRARFHMFEQTQEKKEELMRINEEKGNGGFLDVVMDSCEPLPPNATDLEFSDAEGALIPCAEFVKRHLILQQDAVLAFWGVINKGAEAKNSKRSR